MSDMKKYRFKPRFKIIIIALCLLALVIGVIAAVNYYPTYKAEQRAKQIQEDFMEIPEYDGPNATKIPVMTYHMLISSDDNKHTDTYGASLFVRQDEFETHMKYLNDNGYRTIGTREMYLWHQGKIKLPPKSVMITFDDGDYSVIKFALPILKHSDQRSIIFSIGKEALEETTDTQETEKGNYFSTGQDAIKVITENYPKFEFQSHTYNMHRKIDGEPALLVSSYQEQVDDFKIMTQELHFTTMAYPFGKYSKTTIKAAKAAGVKMAFTYGEDQYTTRDQSIYELGRIKVNAGASLNAFTKWLAPVDSIDN